VQRFAVPCSIRERQHRGFDDRDAVLQETGGGFENKARRQEINAASSASISLASPITLTV
jgi:hypothetical protein